MTSLFRRASKLIKQNSSNIDGIDELSQTSSIDVSSVAKKGLFSGLAKKGQSSGDQVPLVENSPTATTTTNPVAGFLRKNTISRRDTVAKNKEAEKEKEKETLADASSALASARRARSNHSLNEEAKDLMGELDYTQAPATPAIPSMDLTKKATVGRSVTTGAKKPSRFNKIEAKNALDEQEPAIRKSAALLSVTRDNSGYTGRTSVTSINKKTPSSHNISKLGTDSITAKESNNSVFSYTEAPPIPLPLSIPQTDSSGLPKLPTKLSSTAAAIASLPQHSIPITAKSRALTEQPTTSNLFAASKSSANLNFNPSSSSIPKKQHPLQTHSSINNDSQKQLTAAGANLLTTSARQEKRNAGLSAYEISGPKENAITQTSLKRYTLDDWHIVRRVGRGGFAIVFLVRQKGSTGRYFALKAIRKAEVVKLKQEKQIVNEKEILKNVRHNFIVELFYTFQDTHYLYMVMEYIDGGDLFSYLRKVQKFGDEDSKFYAAEVLMSLQYLHSENVVFRDLKPEVQNIVFQNRNMID
ncbi:hypothetical protein HK100_010591 [Physocladia obscura]|uniref:cAMP-dependent protein kinase n=1 Tax=Physocladia obscura TaxID=109957 RepID=A0AAD5T279_9FUNG|nr:hypothetical protein HK100_010591 [Physocladia obscura]